MKRFILFLLISFLLFFISCKEKNPFEVDTDLPKETGAGNLPKVIATYPENRSCLYDEEPNTPGIQAVVVITFSDYMDETTINRDAITILNTTTLSTFSPDTIFYNNAARSLYIKSDNWSGSSAFLLSLKADKIKNKFGKPLDGDADNEEDGAPYDDFLLTFWTSGSLPDSCVDILPPKITSLSPDTQRITNPLPQISISFSKNIDTSTLNITTIKLISEDGASLPVNINKNPRWLSFSPRESLIWGKIYTFKLIANEIKAESVKGCPNYILKLDSDNDGPEADEPDFSSYFLLDTITPPTIENVIRESDNFVVRFSTLMDESSLSEERVKGFDSKGYNPGRIVILTENNKTTLYYYFLRPVEGRIKIFISRDCLSKNGRKLDANGNGIGGEVFDDYWNM